MTTTSEKPGALDPARIGVLSWEEKQVRPSQDQVLIRLDAPKETTSGIIIVESARSSGPQLATVVAVGPKVRDFSAGDRILVGEDPGWVVGSCRMLRAGAVLGVVE